MNRPPDLELHGDRSATPAEPRRRPGAGNVEPRSDLTPDQDPFQAAPRDLLGQRGGHALGSLSPEGALPDTQDHSAVRRQVWAGGLGADCAVLSPEGTDAGATMITREEWIAREVERAPDISVDAWRRTLRLLTGSRKRA